MINYLEIEDRYPFFPGQHGKLAPETNLDVGVAVASAGPDANHLHLTPDR